MRELIGKLVEGAAGPVVIDLEAGLENFSRGTPRHTDHVLVILEPYYKSLEVGRRIVEMARELGIARVNGVANKIRSEAERAAIRQFARAHHLDMLAFIPHDDEVLEADRRGRSPMDTAPESASVREIRTMAAGLQ